MANWYNLLDEVTKVRQGLRTLSIQKNYLNVTASIDDSRAVMWNRLNTAIEQTVKSFQLYQSTDNDLTTQLLVSRLKSKVFFGSNLPKIVKDLKKILDMWA